MSARRQPSEDRLLAFAAGTLSLPESVVVATHLALRPQTRAWTDLAQAVGGQVLNTLEPTPLDASALDDVMARLDAPSPVIERHKAAGLARYFGKFARTPAERALAALLGPAITLVLVMRARLRR